MKKIFQKVIILSCFIFGQTSDQVKQAKKVIQQTGMSKKQVIDEAKNRGYTDQQINNILEKEKVTNTGSGKSESFEKTGLFELGKSNEIIKENSTIEAKESIADEELPLENEENLEIIEGNVVRKSQPSRARLTYFWV